MFVPTKLMMLKPEKQWLSTMGWMEKAEIFERIRGFKWYAPGWVRVSTVLWNGSGEWGVGDEMYRYEVNFTLPKYKGEFIEYLHEASLWGYSIRTVAPDRFTGIYLDKRGDMSTNIDLELMEMLESIDMDCGCKVYGI